MPIDLPQRHRGKTEFHVEGRPLFVVRYRVVMRECRIEGCHDGPSTAAAVTSTSMVNIKSHDHDGLDCRNGKPKLEEANQTKENAKRIYVKRELDPPKDAPSLVFE